MTEHTQFDYLLNAFEQASQSEKPADLDYAGKRKALYAYVRGLEGKDQLAQQAVEIERDNAEGMAESMRMFREDMIKARVIGESVPPMFMTEAILGAIGGARDKALKEAAKLAENSYASGYDTGKAIRALKPQQPAQADKEMP